MIVSYRLHHSTSYDQISRVQEQEVMAELLLPRSELIELQRSTTLLLLLHK